MVDWNPNLYLKFERERTQPVKDLISRIATDNPGRILDVGCGPGNSTKELQQRWPNAKITGLDNSPAMIAKAKETLPGLEWITANASADLSFLGTFDLVFSNAAIQWIPDHKKLLPHLYALLNAGGRLAVQIPNVTDMGIHKVVQRTVAEKQWQGYFSAGVTSIFYDSPAYYYDILSKLTPEIDLWETHYFHSMDSHQSIVEWYRAAGLRPYLEKLPTAALQEDFLNDVLTGIKAQYPVQQDGMILFPFRRIFFIAHHATR